MITAIQTFGQIQRIPDDLANSTYHADFYNIIIQLKTRLKLQRYRDCIMPKLRRPLRKSGEARRYRTFCQHWLRSSKVLSAAFIKIIIIQFTAKIVKVILIPENKVYRTQCNAFTTWIHIHYLRTIGLSLKYSG